MSALLDSLRRNAFAATVEAESSDLPNVRDRFMRAAARWTEMADRQEELEGMQRSRDQANARKHELAED